MAKVSFKKRKLPKLKPLKVRKAKKSSVTKWKKKRY